MVKYIISRCHDRISVERLPEKEYDLAEIVTLENIFLNLILQVSIIFISIYSKISISFA